MPEKTTLFSPANYLETDEDIADYLEALSGNMPDDEFLIHALKTVAHARAVHQNISTNDHLLAATSLTVGSPLHSVIEVVQALRMRLSLSMATPIADTMGIGDQNPGEQSQKQGDESEFLSWVDHIREALASDLRNLVKITRDNLNDEALIDKIVQGLATGHAENFAAAIYEIAEVSGDQAKSLEARLKGKLQ